MSDGGARVVGVPEARAETPRRRLSDDGEPSLRSASSTKRKVASGDRPFDDSKDLRKP